MNRLLALLLMACLLAIAPAGAASTTSKLKNNLTVTGNLAVTGTTASTGATTLSTLTTTGAATLNSLTVTGATTLTTPLTAANIQTGSAKRQLLHAQVSPATAACADSTVYSALLFPGRAGTVKAITFGCQTAPAGGTDTLKVLKASSSGNTMLSAASVDATTLTNNTATAGTLTGTGADLGLTAAQGIYCEYSAGVQTTDAVDVSVTVEFEPTDF